MDNLAKGGGRGGQFWLKEVVEVDNQTKGGGRGGHLD